VLGWIIIVQFANEKHPSVDAMVPILYKKTFCWRSAQGLGRPATPSQIDHSQGTYVYPRHHYVN
jgi:hypothetical protein